MRTVLVPLDGSDLSAAILDDAVRLAGPGGTLILTQEVPRPRGRAAVVYSPQVETESAHQYLSGVAEGLRSRGASARAVIGVTFHVSTAIDELAKTHHVDMIACATHSRGTVGTLLRGSVAWNMLSHSPVPVLLRHPGASYGLAGSHPVQPRILVPVDGSAAAEEALPLAQELAAEWQALIDLVLVNSSTPLEEASIFAAEDYLSRLADKLPGQVQHHVLVGNPADALTAFVQGAHITDIVMTSHGRTGLARTFAGSVAHDIIRRLPIPVIVIPHRAIAASKQPKAVEAATV